MSIAKRQCLHGLSGLLIVLAATTVHANENLRIDRGLVQGSIGQFDAEPLQPSSGGAFSVTGGFWAGLSSAPAPAGTELFEDGFEAR